MMHLSILGLVILSPAWTWAGVPSVEGILVTDVTDRSFSVVWTSSEPSTGTLNVFDALPPPGGGTFQIPTAGVSLYPSPVKSPDIAVQNANGVTPVEGGILAVDLVDLGSSPVTGYVEDGIVAPSALANLNNLYDTTLRQIINLVGNERIRLLEFRGKSGCTLERFRKVPPDLESGEVKEPLGCYIRSDLDCSDTVNICGGWFQSAEWRLHDLGSKDGEWKWKRDVSARRDRLRPCLRCGFCCWECSEVYRHA
jgi:hypothetical protein